MGIDQAAKRSNSAQTSAMRPDITMRPAMRSAFAADISDSTKRTTRSGCWGEDFGCDRLVWTGEQLTTTGSICGVHLLNSEDWLSDLASWDVAVERLVDFFQIPKPAKTAFENFKK